MKILKQNSGSKNCVQVCANMASDANKGEWEFIMKNKPIPYSDYDFAYFMFLKGFMVTAGIPGEAIQEMINVGDSVSGDEFIPNGEPITEETEIIMKFKVGDFPAYVVVKSQGDDKDLEHAIYWDGKKVHDPSPFVGSEQTLNDYEILRYFPIVHSPPKEEPEKSRIIKL